MASTARRCVVSAALPMTALDAGLFSAGVEFCSGCSAVYYIRAPTADAAHAIVADKIRASYDHVDECPYLAKP